MKRQILAVVVSCAALLLLTGCDPPPVSVSVKDFSFTPAAADVTRGGTVRWTNNGSFGHTSTDSTALGLWNSGQLNPGDAFTTKFVAAGSYAYFCSIHNFMTGTVKVPIAVSPTSGTTATVFTVTVASSVAPSGFQYVVQKKNPGGAFTAFRTLTAATTTFQATATGTYQFRSSLERTASTATSGFSDPQTITVH